MQRMEKKKNQKKNQKKKKIIKTNSNRKIN